MRTFPLNSGHFSRVRQPKHFLMSRPCVSCPNNRTVNSFLQLFFLTFRPRHTCPDIFEKGDFFVHCRKNTPPHVTYSNRFCPSTRKTLRRIEIRLQATQGMRCMMYDIMISYSKTSVIVHTISRHFKNLLSGECFWKDAFSLTVFTGYVWTVAVTDRG